MNDSALIVLIAMLVSLGGCGDEKPAAAKAPPVHTAQKEASHRPGDHAEEEDGKDRHAVGKHEQPTHTKSGQAHEESGAEKIVLTPTQIKIAGIETAQAGPAPIREWLPLYGSVAPNAERMRDVAARYAGTIQRVDKKIGDPVRRGETLATVESNESLQTYAVVAPLTGVVTVRNANPGEQTTEKPLFTVADLSTVWIELSLFPRDVAKVRVGQSVRVRSTDAGLTANGTVAYVAPFGSSANQTLTARVILDNSDHRWAPGLYVNTDVALSEQPAAIAIRNDSLQTVEGKTAVFVQHANGFDAHPVTLGRSDGEYSEVLTGLNVSDTYATANSFVLKAELSKGDASHEH